MAVLHIPVRAHAEEPPGVRRPLGGNCQRPQAGGPQEDPHHHSCPPAGKVGPLFLCNLIPCIRDGRPGQGSWDALSMLGTGMRTLSP